jgi:WD40 repeat protein/serine/threonine protein kinase
MSTNDERKMNQAQSIEETIFETARQIGDPEKKAAYLDQACGSDQELRRRIESLLRAGRKAREFFQGHNPVASLGAAENFDSGAGSEGPGSLIGRYKLLQRLGEGGCGIVYMAEQEEPVKRKVALKVIKLGMDTKEVVARFEAERQAVALMDHPNIAKVLDGGATATGRPYFVMELVRGIPITRYCDENRLSTKQRLMLFIVVCQAIQHAHQKGIIHRDIKPSNILVADHDGTPVPKVIDFGIAKATAGQTLTNKTLFTAFEQFIGTPAYMSPEQAKLSGLDIDTRSDIYSLGVLLYELLTGTTPFEPKRLVRAGLEEICRIVREEEPPRPSTRLSTLEAADQTALARQRQIELPKLVHLMRGDLDWIVMKTLEKDRNRRYETANGLAMDIQRQLNQEPVLARPPSVAYRLHKSFRRNRVLFSAATLVALALVSGAVVSSWQAFRATAAGRRARTSELAARQSLYAADLSLAYRAWNEGDIGVALELLNNHVPAAGEPDLRGWEWRHLLGACQSDERYTFTNLPTAVFEVRVSPDGRLLATAGNYFGGAGALCLWEIASRKLFACPEPNDAGGSVVFSPDGKLLAYETVHHGYKLYDLAKKAEVQRIPGGPCEFGSPLGLAFSPDGHMLATHQAAGAILIWDLQRKAPVSTLVGAADHATSLAFLPGGQTLVSSYYDSTIRFWSVASGQELHRLTNHAGIYRMVLSPDGNTLATSTVQDGIVQIWDVKGMRHFTDLTMQAPGVWALAFSPDGKTLASGSHDSIIRLWNTRSWEEVTTLRGSLREVWSVAFAPDGKTLFSGAKDGAVKVWDTTPRPREQNVLSRPADGGGVFFGGLFTDFHTFPDTGITVAWHTNHTFTLWKRGSLRPAGVYRTPDFETLFNALSVTFSPNGDRVAWVTAQGAIVVWDILGERQLATVPWLSGGEIPPARWLGNWLGSGGARAVVGATSPDGKRLCFAAPNRLTIWNLETLEEMAALPKSPEAPEADSLCFANDGQSIALADDRCSIEVWNLARKEHLGPWHSHYEDIDALTFSSDGKALVSASQDTTIKLWDINTQKELRRFGRTQHAYNSVAISPDGTRVAGGEALGFIKIWDAATGQEVALLKSPKAGVSYLSFLPDGNTLLSGNAEEVRLWRAPSWQEIKAKRESRGPLPGSDEPNQ